MTNEVADAVVIGGGFYGAVIAIYLAKQRGLKRIVILEKETKLMQRASYKNQARVHNGYHYPRSFTTAYRSRVNLPKFILDWPQSVKQDFTSLYAIARHNSKVTSKQFLRFCKEIEASTRPALPEHRELFNQNLIESVFEVDEYVFDSSSIAKWVEGELTDCNVKVVFKTTADAISKSTTEELMVNTHNEDKIFSTIHSRYVINCTYSGLNQISGNFSCTRQGLKQEITEMALVQVPSLLNDVGITVMDGPFFSLMPFPARDLHTLSHVRYTPHQSWKDELTINPYEKLRQYPQITRVDRMLRDAGRYIPSILDSQYIESLFEVKTVLEKNEGDDGRPILFEKHAELPGCYSILGGKMDNVYDVLEKLNGENFIHLSATL